VGSSFLNLRGVPCRRVSLSERNRT